MAEPLRLGVSFDGFTSVRDAVEVARRAEALGATSFWIADHLGYRETFVTATAIALATRDAVVYPTAISPYLRHPVPVAMAAASIGELAPGRIGLAIGTGNPMFLREAGLEAEKPIAAIGEYVKALRGLFSGDPVQQEGVTFRLAGARLAFKPDPEPTIFITAMGPQMLRLSGRIADGVVFSAGLSASYIGRSIALVTEGAESGGRAPDEVTKSSYIVFMGGGDPADMRDKVREKLAFIFRNKMVRENIETSGLPIDQDAVMQAIARRDIAAARALVPSEAVDEFTITGDADDCRRRVSEYRDAGLDELVLTLVGTTEDRLRSVEMLREIL